MSKNPAWAACQKAVDAAEKAYETAVAPSREEANKTLHDIASEFDATLKNLVTQRDEAISKAREKFSKMAMEAQKVRTDAISTAKAVLADELGKKEKVPAQANA